MQYTDTTEQYQASFSGHSPASGVSVVIADSASNISQNLVQLTSQAKSHHIDGISVLDNTPININAATLSWLAKKPLFHYMFQGDGNPASFDVSGTASQIQNAFFTISDHIGQINAVNFTPDPSVANGVNALTLQVDTKHKNITVPSVFEGLQSATLVGDTRWNKLTGGVENDMIYGNGGNDTLTGGGGSDVFVLSSRPTAKNSIATITDFSASYFSMDTIALSKSVFTSLVPGSNGKTLNSNQFFSFSGQNPDTHTTPGILYNTDTGALYYDKTGDGHHHMNQIAIIGQGDTHPHLFSGEFTLI